ncbi:energy transducer TonB [Phenylobacterium sp. LjRoot164]|uniref:energy transducer TonB n=1 Tax=unclassified Phenylobacterium TaxID=2640670 RepID=UPI003ED02AA2
MNIYAAGAMLALLAAGPALAKGPQILPAELPTSNPWWTCKGKPPPRYYPAAAQRQGIEGAAITQCRLDEKRRPTSCTWLEEDKPGHGFGDAAAKLGCIMRFTAPPDETAAPGTVAVFPMRFSLPPR